MSWILQVEKMGTNFINGGFWIGGAVDDQLSKVTAIDFTYSTMISGWFLRINMTNLSELMYPSLAGGNMGK